MKRATGLIALVCLLAAANLMAWHRDLFVWQVGLPLLAGLAAGLAWLVMLLTAQLATFRSQGRAVGGLNAIFSSVVFFGICAVVYAFFGLGGISMDLTKEGRRDLEPQTIQVLQTMNKPIEITCFFLASDDDLIKIAREKTLRFLDECQEHSTLLNVTEEDPQVAVEKWEAKGITRASPQGTVVIECGERSRVLTLSGASPRLEERDFTNALISLLRDSEPKVCFLTGHGERRAEEGGPQGGSALTDLLKRESYQAESIAIKLTEPVVPADCDVLVINNPTADFQPPEIDALEEYVARGGRILLMMDPWIRVGTGTEGEQLRPWLEKRLGIVVGSDVVVAEERQEALQVELNADSGTFSEADREAPYNGCYAKDHPITRAFDQPMLLQIARTAGIVEKAPEKVTVVGLLRTGPEFWAETDVAGLRETQKASRGEGEQRGPLILASAASVQTEVPIEGANAKRESRVVVVGDSSISANDTIQIPGNVNFLLNAIAWLSESEQLIAIRPRGDTDPPLVLSAGEERAVFWVSTLMTAQIALGAGLLMAALRRRNQ